MRHVWPVYSVLGWNSHRAARLDWMPLVGTGRIERGVDGHYSTDIRKTTRNGAKPATGDIKAIQVSLKLKENGNKNCWLALLQSYLIRHMQVPTWIRYQLSENTHKHQHTLEMMGIFGAGAVVPHLDSSPVE
ncbi:hypothetical protein NXS19_003804 [Fusarium pseudograminearum]|nr:hypothetical protein NXS19_003804 [Fusarium pseudograminearum]